MKLYVKTSGRELALLSNGYVLVFKTANTKNTGRNSSKKSSNLPQQQKTVIVESLPINELKEKGFTEIVHMVFEGFLGLLCVKDNIYLCLIRTIQETAHPRWKLNPETNIVEPIERVNQILSVDFFCLTTSLYDYVMYPNIEQHSEKLYADHPCHSLRKLLCDGSFYYSRDFDLTNTLQERGLLSNMDYIVEKFEERYVWNINMISEMIQFRSRVTPNEKEFLDKGKFITFVIRGFCKTKLSEISVDPVCVTIISKLSTENRRNLFGLSGIDPGGNVSNFAETEIIVSTEAYTFAYTMNSGNVPLSWDVSEGQILHNKKIKLNKSPEYTQSAFDKHFDRLMSKYGVVSVVNLVKPKSDSQDILGHAYKECADHKGLRFTNVEYSSDILTKFTHKLLYYLKQDIYEFGALVYDVNRGIYIGKQTGVIRISAFNSIKRPCLVEKCVSEEVIELAFNEVDDAELPNDFHTMYERLWKEAIYFLNQIYNQSVKNSSKYQRLYHKLLSSTYKITLYDPLHTYILNYLKTRKEEFLYNKEIRIFAGTFNVGGRIYKGDLDEWLFPNVTTADEMSDIYAIGFEEVVELSPGQMLITDPFVKPFWEKDILKHLNSRNCSDSNKYISLWSGQLGGVLLMVFIREDESMNVRHIEGDVKKTGFGGMSANKGAVAVSFSYSTTKFCFIVAHLAAGLDNVEQRHNDYKTINKNIRFARGITIKDHDAIIWMGDFNYRISMSNESTRKLVSEGKYSVLFEKDQLNQQMIAGESFPYFNEMEIRFPPTYKFDPGTSNYDTSEKNRIPAWTDRVLSRGDILQQNSYGCAENIMFSDHRPVYSTFTSKVVIVNEALKTKLADEIYSKLQVELINLSIDEKWALLQNAENTETLINNEHNNLYLNDDGGNSTDNFMASSYSLNEMLAGGGGGVGGNGGGGGVNVISNGTNNTKSSTATNIVPGGSANMSTSTSIGNKKGSKKLPPPSTDTWKWWMGNGKQSSIMFDVDSNKYMINPKRGINPFDPEDDNDPFFVSRIDAMKSGKHDKDEVYSNDEHVSMLNNGSTAKEHTVIGCSDDNGEEGDKDDDNGGGDDVGNLTKNIVNNVRTEASIDETNSGKDRRTKNMNCNDNQHEDALTQICNNNNNTNNTNNNIGTHTLDPYKSQNTFLIR